MLKAIRERNHKVRSPSFIQFSFRKSSPISEVRTAGSTKQTRSIPHHMLAPPSGIAGGGPGPQAAPESACGADGREDPCGGQATEGAGREASEMNTEAASFRAWRRSSGIKMELFKKTCRFVHTPFRIFRYNAPWYIAWTGRSMGICLFGEESRRR